ncbi:uncharacterized protein FIBRA_01437 [Fibroporia radiculosa]|uniref:Uncharacterized protein n=1 Tax=Fibroporia radiculosa TaxID=599839 RepID=J4H143_9APHY|nr:uncharacterized protein FIBRA_01437 [Fibroporia radiculosa]CCL99419.1 predicted protein [Fibroporia radiculosa]
MSSFSRLQLAAALIEYDNDDSNPDAPKKSAHDSAIFAPLRRMNPQRRSTASRKSTDYLGVALPSETGSVAARDSVLGGRESVFGGRESILDGRRSRGSSDALRNPFARDSTFEGALDEDEEDIEVDLTSWGLDALVTDDKDHKGSRRKAKTDSLPNPHPIVAPVQQPELRAAPGRQGITPTRTMSLGTFDSFGEGGAFLEARSTMGPLTTRRHSVGAPLELPPAKQPVQEHPRRGRTASEHVLIENIPVTPPLHSIPFPTSESVRSISPMPNLNDGASIARPSSRGSEAMLRSRGRAYSTASLGSQMLLNEQESNPFAIRAPSPDRASRFDPKARARTTSYGSMGSMMFPDNAEETNPFALRPPSPSRSSRFDPKVRARTMSNGSLGTQMILDNDVRSVDDGEQRPRSRLYSRLELMRPKVLIMPSPLQSAAPAAPKQTIAMEGFELHDDGRPLPPGARTTRRSSTTLSMLDPSPALIASNSFTPNPRASLTLSQLTFRNTLAVDGGRDPSYADIDNDLRRATEEGEQILPEPESEPLPSTPAPAIVVDPADRSKRPAGKLYGKSLIDDLETRKAEMKSKSRVFRGDDRPSMMARTSIKRSSTLIDPDSLKQRPQLQGSNSFHSQPSLSKRESKTLVNLDDDIPGVRKSQHIGLDTMNAANKKSVFGVDTLWERELAKLREIEERERIEAEEAASRQVIEEEKKGKGKGKGKKKNKHKKATEEPGLESITQPSASNFASESALEPRAPSPPYVLPAIERATRRHPPPPAANGDTDEESDSDDQPLAGHRQTVVKEVEANEWGSSDEEGGPVRTTGSGPRFPNGRSRGSSNAPKLVTKNIDDSSEDDLPLVATISRAATRMTRAEFSREDTESDEEKPLSTLLDKSTIRLNSVGAFGSSLFPDTPEQAADEEDDKPLGLRVSRAMNLTHDPSSLNQDVDDDKPLAFHPDQMRRTQYMMAQQQQQQQMMMQAQAAQLHQSMIFGAPSMMGSGFFGPPIPPPMLMPQLPTTPPPPNDAVKFGRVDKWRHDVAVEEEQ